MKKKEIKRFVWILIFILGIIFIIFGLKLFFIGRFITENNNLYYYINDRSHYYPIENYSFFQKYPYCINNTSKSSFNFEIQTGQTYLDIKEKIEYDIKSNDEIGQDTFYDTTGLSMYPTLPDASSCLCVLEDEESYKIGDIASYYNAVPFGNRRNVFIIHRIVDVYKVGEKSNISQEIIDKGLYPDPSIGYIDPSIKVFYLMKGDDNNETDGLIPSSWMLCKVPQSYYWNVNQWIDKTNSNNA